MNTTISRFAIVGLLALVAFAATPTAEAGVFKAPHCDRYVVNLDDHTSDCSFTWQGVDHDIVPPGFHPAE